MEIEGYVFNDQDCDDSNDFVNPTADEYCDEVDNDCDDQVDEEDAVDQSVFYLDEDGDGSGVVDFIKSLSLYQMKI